jgi:hypothetical protein
VKIKHESLLSVLTGTRFTTLLASIEHHIKSRFNDEPFQRRFDAYSDDPAKRGSLMLRVAAAMSTEEFVIEPLF